MNGQMSNRDATLTLSSHAFQVATELAAELGFASVREYVEVLIEEEAIIERPTPLELRIQTREQLESLLRKTKDSSAKPWNQAEWNRLRAELMRSKPDEARPDAAAIASACRS